MTADSAHSGDSLTVTLGEVHLKCATVGFHGKSQVGKVSAESSTRSLDYHTAGSASDLDLFRDSDNLGSGNDLQGCERLKILRKSGKVTKTTHRH
jgi:hypothetical protein